MTVASSERLKSFSVHANYTPTHCIRTRHVLKKLKMPMSYRQSMVNALHIVVALLYFTIVCTVKSVFVEVVNFVMIRGDKSCNPKLIMRGSNFLIEKTKELLSSNCNNDRISFFGCSMTSFCNEQRGYILTFLIRFQFWVSVMEFLSTG